MGHQRCQAVVAGNVVIQKGLTLLPVIKGLYGIENMDYKYLAEDLVENEPLLFAK